MTTLKPLTEYIDELNEASKNATIETILATESMLWVLLMQHVRFIKTPLSLGQFIPTDKDGKPLEKPNVKNYEGKDTRNIDYDQDCLRYETALSKVLFKGWEYKVGKSGNVKISKAGCSLLFNNGIIDPVRSLSTAKTIENIAHLNLELTEYGKEKLL